MERGRTVRRRVHGRHQRVPSSGGGLTLGSAAVIVVLAAAILLRFGGGERMEQLRAAIGERLGGGAGYREAVAVLGQALSGAGSGDAITVFGRSVLSAEPPTAQEAAAQETAAPEAAPPPAQNVFAELDPYPAETTAASSVEECPLPLLQLPVYYLPLEGELTSPYGWRSDPFTGRRSFHTGVDLAAVQGTPVCAMAEGTVLEVGTSRVYGKYILLQHEDGMVTKYAHLHYIGVEEGEAVAGGEQIAQCGNTGRSTGSHLHFEVRLHRETVDPLSYLPMDDAA